LVLLALLGIVAGLQLWPEAPEVTPGPATAPTRFAPAPNVAASAGAAAPTRTPAVIRQLQVVDRDTQLPLADCGLRLQQRPARTEWRRPEVALMTCCVSKLPPPRFSNHATVLPK